MNYYYDSLRIQSKELILQFCFKFILTFVDYRKGKKANPKLKYTEIQIKFIHGGEPGISLKHKIPDMGRFFYLIINKIIMSFFK